MAVARRIGEPRHGLHAALRQFRGAGVHDFDIGLPQRVERVTIGQLVGQFPSRCEVAVARARHHQVAVVALIHLHVQRAARGAGTGHAQHLYGIVPPLPRVGGLDHDVAKRTDIQHAGLHWFVAMEPILSLADGRRIVLPD
ncbi:hypothetical protein D3C81_1204460 [compost metagenome]